MAGLEQALLAIRGEVEFIDVELARLASERTRLIAALDLLEGPAATAPAAKTVVVVDAGGPQGPGGELCAEGPSTTPTTVTPEERAVFTALLEHPERVEGAVRQGNGAWIRADGHMWSCSCGRRVRTLSKLRDHLKVVVDPGRHRPEITEAADVPEAAENIPENIPASIPAVGPGPVLPYACACGDRYLTVREWSAHVKQHPAQTRQHRLADQPKAALVPTGLPAPKPAVEPLHPAVAALQGRQIIRSRRPGGDAA